MDNYDRPINWTIPLTLGTAGLAGFLAGHLLGKRRRSAKAVQKLVVADLQKEGPLTGSWIEHDPVPYQQFAKQTFAYRGGFRRPGKRATTSYRFLADAYTGALLEVERDQ